MTSPELTGGAGFTYEDAVTAQYLAAMVAGTTAAALNPRVVQQVAQQQADFGEPLDDVIVDAACLDGTVKRLSLQVQLIAKGMIWSPSHGDTAFTCRCSMPSCSGSCRRMTGGVSDGSRCGCGVASMDDASRMGGA